MIFLNFLVKLGYDYRDGRILARNVAYQKKAEHSNPQMRLREKSFPLFMFSCYDRVATPYTCMK